MHSVVASLAVELQESQFLSEHQTISHVKVGSGGQPCVWMRRGNIFKNIKEGWMSGPGIIWTTELLRCKSVLNGYLNTSLSDCTDLLSDNTSAVPVKLSISRNKGLQRGVSPARVCDCTKYECVHTSNTGQTRGARSDASRHVSESKNLI